MREQTTIEALQKRYAALTRREQEIMDLVVRGRLNKLIAAQLGISEVTVKAHRGNVMRKMDADCLPALVHMAAALRRASAPTQSALSHLDCHRRSLPVGGRRSASFAATAQ